MALLSVCSCVGEALRCNGVNKAEVLEQVFCLASVSYFFLKNSHVSLNRKMFRNNRRLIRIELTDNELRIDTDMFEDLTELRVLVIENTMSESFQYLPEHIFHNNTKLRMLLLEGNNITDIGVSTFKGKTELRVLDLSENVIKNLEPGTFTDNPRLQKLDLSRNKIQQVKSGVFIIDGASNAILNLSHNPIDMIHEDAFKHCSAVTHLDLSHSYIRHLNENLFKGMTSISDIDISYTRVVRLQIRMFQKPTRVDIGHKDITAVNPDRIYVNLHYRGTDLKCKCNPVKYTYDETESSVFNFEIACDSNQPWNNAPTLSCPASTSVTSQSVNGSEQTDNTSGRSATVDSERETTGLDGTETDVDKFTPYKRSSHPSSDMRYSEISTVLPENSRASSSLHPRVTPRYDYGVLYTEPSSTFEPINTTNISEIGREGELHGGFIVLGFCLGVVLFFLIICFVLYRFKSWYSVRRQQQRVLEEDVHLL